MVASAYLQPDDYAAYGVVGVTDAQISAASRLVDAQVGRPEGLLWSPDADGLPAWMTLKTPSRVCKLPADTQAGTSVTIAFSNLAFGQGDVGSVVIIDRADPAAAEACIVTGASGDALTLDAFVFDHPANATVEFGLTITEEATVNYGGMIRTSARPLARLLSVSGSYRSGRRDRGNAWIDELLTIGTAPTTQIWNNFPVGQCDVDDATGVCWLLPGTVRGGFSRCRVSYIAGWSYDTLPAAIKQAAANILIGQTLEPGMGGNIQTLKSGDATITRFRPGSLDQDTMALLAPYRNIRI